MEEQNNSKVIGKVAALESQPSTIDEFYFWTKKDTLLNPFDVVVVNHIENSKTYGVVEEISHITDSDSFLGSFISNDFGEISCPMMTDRVGMNYVRARVVENTKGILIPVHNGELVSLGSKEEIQEALGLKKMKNPVVCGYLEMYSGKVEEDKVKLPVYVNSDFLIGPEGAHLNISGISGLASKTSYAMFLLNALQQRSLKEEESKSVAYICLNVKGRDLLTIDEPANDLPEDSKAMYKEMGLELQPFQNVKYFYPRPKNNEISVSSYVRKVGRGRTFFFAAFGRTEDEFLELLKMPESFIIKRWDAEVCGLTEDWRKEYRALSKKNKDILLGIVNANTFNPEEWKSLPPAVCKVLDFYLYRDQDVPAVDADKKSKFIDQFGASCTMELSAECKRLLSVV